MEMDPSNSTPSRPLAFSSDSAVVSVSPQGAVRAEAPSHEDSSSASAQANFTQVAQNGYAQLPLPSLVNATPIRDALQSASPSTLLPTTMSAVREDLDEARDERDEREQKEDLVESPSSVHGAQGHGSEQGDDKSSELDSRPGAVALVNVDLVYTDSRLSEVTRDADLPRNPSPTPEPSARSTNVISPPPVANHSGLSSVAPPLISSSKTTLPSSQSTHPNRIPASFVIPPFSRRISKEPIPITVPSESIATPSIIARRRPSDTPALAALEFAPPKVAESAYIQSESVGKTNEGSSKNRESSSKTGTSDEKKREHKERDSTRSKRVLGEWIMSKTLGAGSMGKVKLAVSNITGEKVRPLALKP